MAYTVADRDVCGTVADNLLSTLILSPARMNTLDMGQWLLLDIVNNDLIQKPHARIPLRKPTSPTSRTCELDLAAENIYIAPKRQVPSVHRRHHHSQLWSRACLVPMRRRRKKKEERRRKKKKKKKKKNEVSACCIWYVCRAPHQMNILSGRVRLSRWMSRRDSDGKGKMQGKEDAENFVHWGEGGAILASTEICDE